MKMGAGFSPRVFSFALRPCHRFPIHTHCQYTLMHGTCVCSYLEPSKASLELRCCRGWLSTTSHPCGRTGLHESTRDGVWYVPRAGVSMHPAQQPTTSKDCTTSTTEKKTVKKQPTGQN
jgi:hypothetical protein